jgi:uncharacterized protein with LGFP repeats
MRNCGPSYTTTTKAVALHHTAGTNSYSASQSAGLVRGIYAYHTQSLDWCDIGYNVLVDKYGQIFEGRYGGLDRPVLGAHSLGFNTDNFGVSVLGTHSSTAPSSAALTAIARVSAWRLDGFYVYGMHSSTHISQDSGSRYPKGTRVTLNNLFGHRDVYATECPGASLYARRNTLRSMITSRENYGSSPVYKRWAAAGGRSSGYGHPARVEKATPFGVRQLFSNGHGLWSTPGGTRRLDPPLASFYEAYSGPQSYGEPLSDSKSNSGGKWIDTRTGYTIAVPNGDSPHVVRPGIRGYWAAYGGVSSHLGFPISGQYRPTSDGVGQVFQGGRIYDSASTPTKFVSWSTLTKYIQTGGPSAFLGYPTSSIAKVANRTGTMQRYEHGYIYSKSGVGAFTTRGAIATKYASLNGPASRLGFPTADQRSVSPGAVQKFEHGTITWNSSTNQTTVTYH